VGIEVNVGGYVERKIVSDAGHVLDVVAKLVMVAAASAVWELVDVAAE
jgi:hypothetical protein